MVYDTIAYVFNTAVNSLVITAHYNHNSCCLFLFRGVICRGQIRPPEDGWYVGASSVQQGQGGLVEAIQYQQISALFDPNFW